MRTGTPEAALGAQACLGRALSRKPPLSDQPQVVPGPVDQKLEVFEACFQVHVMAHHLCHDMLISWVVAASSSTPCLELAAAVRCDAGDDQRPPSCVPGRLLLDRAPR